MSINEYMIFTQYIAPTREDSEKNYQKDYDNNNHNLWSTMAGTVLMTSYVFLVVEEKTKKTIMKVS